MDEVSGVPEQERLIPLPEEGSDTMPDDDDEMLDLAALEASVAGVEAYLASVDDIDADPPPPPPTLDDMPEGFPDDLADEPPVEAQGTGAFEAIATGGAVDVDVPVPPRPDAADRLGRLQSAGAAMRGAIRDEIRAASDDLLEAALARARAEIAMEVGRFEEEMRRELDVVREDLRRRAADDRSDVVAERLFSVESRLEELAAMLEETREAVLGLRRRYLPSGGNGGGLVPEPS